MQPLLMLKQTLEAPYDPGPLKLDGPHVTFTNTKEFLSNNGKDTVQFTIQIGFVAGRQITNVYQTGSRLELIETTFDERSEPYAIRHNLSQEEIMALFHQKNPHWDRESQVVREKAFLTVQPIQPLDQWLSPIPWSLIIPPILRVIHVPGIRTEAKRTYPSAYITENRFSGRFENYAPGILLSWQSSSHSYLKELERTLSRLGLTSAITTSALDETQIEVRVGRTLTSDRNDTVNIADVGFGVSQVLPVLVALLVAEAGQLVYIEQPELHLHPRAQLALAGVIADAADRGVRVVIETHSDLLLLGIQTLVAEGKLASDKVILHWFRRQENGETQITSRNLDKSGAYGDWPEDFGDVQLHAQSRYLDAAGIPELESE